MSRGRDHAAAFFRDASFPCSRPAPGFPPIEVVGDRRARKGFSLRVCGALFLLLVSFSSPGLAGPLLLDPHAGYAPLAGHLEALRDDKGELTYADVLRDEVAARFAPLPGALSAGFVPGGAYWLRFTVQCPVLAPGVWFLEVNPASNGDVQCYAPRAAPFSNGFMRFAQGGEWSRFRTRPVTHHAMVFPLDLPSGGSLTAHLRVASLRSVAATPALWRPDPFWSKAQAEALLHGAYLGVVVLIALTNLVYWRQLREPLYLYYVGYITGMGLVYLCLMGYGLQYLWPESPAVTVVALRIGVSMSIGLHATLLYCLVDLGRAMPLLGRIYLKSCWSFALFGLYGTVMAVTNHAPVVGHIAILCCALSSLCICLTLLRRRATGALLYTLAFGAFLGTACLGFPAAMGWAGDYEGLFKLALAATLTHMLLMNVSVASRIGVLRRDKERFEVSLDAERRLVREQRQFLGMVSHELRTPLSVIDGEVQLMALADPASRRDPAQAARLRANTRKMARLLDNCLGEERLHSDLWQPHPRPTDLRRLVLDAVEPFRAAQPKRRFVLDLDGLPRSFPSDPALVGLALDNLLDNAAKYSPETGAITLRGRWLAPDEVLLEVLDQGPGVAPADAARVFERFARLPETETQPGQGLGLHLVARVAQVHHGEAGVEGSRFWVRLKAQGETKEDSLYL